MAMFEDASDIRTLVLAQYEEDPQFEEAAIRQIRGRVRLSCALRVQLLPAHLARSKPSSEKLKIKIELEGLERMWKAMRFDLEGEEEIQHCRKLVAQRRATLDLGRVAPPASDDAKDDPDAKCVICGAFYAKFRLQEDWDALEERERKALLGDGPDFVFPSHICGECWCPK